MKSVAVFGAGISGMTCAYELLKLGHDVTIYEKNDKVGGLACSRIEDDGMFVEHSWRGFGPFYDYIRRLFDELGIDNALTALKFIMPCDDGSELKRMSISDYIKAIPILLNPSERGIMVQDFSHMSETGLKMIKTMLCPGFGVNADSYPTALMKKYLDLNFVHPGGKWKVLKGPSSECFLEVLADKIRELGGVIKLNKAMTKVELTQDGKTISSVSVESKSGSKQVHADYYVMAVNPYHLAPLVKHISCPQVRLLQGITMQKAAIEIGFSMAFSSDLRLAEVNEVIMLPDSEYNITATLHHRIWDDEFMAKHGLVDSPTKSYSVLSATACQSHVPGVITGKSLHELTHSKYFKSEVLYQISRNKKLQKLWGANFMDSLVDFKVWPGYKFTKNGVVTDDPHWITTNRNYNVRPTHKTSIPNMIFSGAHTVSDSQETISFFSMEGACESGVLAAQLIDEKVEHIDRSEYPAIAIYLLLLVLIIILVIAFVIWVYRWYKNR